MAAGCWGLLVPPGQGNALESWREANFSFNLKENSEGSGCSGNKAAAGGSGELTVTPGRQAGAAWPLWKVGAEETQSWEFTVWQLLKVLSSLLRFMKMLPEDNGEKVSNVC